MGQGEVEGGGESAGSVAVGPQDWGGAGAMLWAQEVDHVYGDGVKGKWGIAGERAGSKG